MQRSPDRAALQEALIHWVDTVADQRKRRVAEYDGEFTIKELYERWEKPLLQFPSDLRTAFDVTCWKAVCSDANTVNIYGHSIPLPESTGSGSTLYIAMRLNGEIIVTNSVGLIVKQTTIPIESISKYKRDQRPSEAPCMVDPRRMSREVDLSIYDKALA